MAESVCLECGAEIPYDWAPCPQCGWKAPNAWENPEEEEVVSKSDGVLSKPRRWIGWTAWILLGIFIFWILSILLKH